LLGWRELVLIELFLIGLIRNTESFFLFSVP